MIFVWDIAVSRPPIVAEPHNGGRRGLPPRHPLVTLLAAIILIESAALVAAVVFLVFELLVATPDSYPSAIALTVVVAIAAVWVAAIGIGVLRGQSWVRGAAIVVQVLLVAIAVGSFQGFIPRPDIGWVLLVPAIAVVVLLFTKPVVAAISRD